MTEERQELDLSRLRGYALTLESLISSVTGSIERTGNKAPPELRKSLDLFWQMFPGTEPRGISRYERDLLMQIPCPKGVGIRLTHLYQDGAVGVVDTIGAADEIKVPYKIYKNLTQYLSEMQH